MAIHGLAKEMNRTIEDHRLNVPKVQEGLALAQCILPFAGIIPVINLAVAVAVLLVTVLNLKQFEEAGVGIPQPRGL